MLAQFTRDGNFLDMAQQSLERALELNPADDVARQNLAMVLVIRLKGFV